MTRSETESALLELFTETGGAHHQAFIASDEADENRALGYATYLRSRRKTAAGVDRGRARPRGVAPLRGAGAKHLGFGGPMIRVLCPRPRGRSGTSVVAVLRCTSGEGDRWMPESTDIIGYLEARLS
ncbi:MAG: hypothetical protein AAFU79_04260 [Myxococcota bacterium]